MRTILHLCADTGSDSAIFKAEGYNVILVGSEVGVENFSYTEEVYGIIANPVCTELSTANTFSKVCDMQKGMFLVNHCLRIIQECNPTFWVLENPANGRLKDELGKPKYVYQPWWYGSPWTKRTALWGKFNIPERVYTSWDDVPKNKDIYVRPGRPKPSLAFLHKSAIRDIPEFQQFAGTVDSDAEFRSLCSQGFARKFFEANNG